ncbi:MAG: DUF1398 family protein [Sphingomonadales bacterium]|nr:DUF1398 family protein [Sphingomonadales bacterium]
MDAERTDIAKMCLDGAHDGSLSFPEIIGKLISAGFDGYAVDYLRNSQTYYLHDGDCADLDMPHHSGSVAAVFDAAAVQALIRWAQANAPDYSYAAFCERVKAAGCAGYLVSFPDRRVVYYGRTAETHVEMFPLSAVSTHATDLRLGLR